MNLYAPVALSLMLLCANPTFASETGCTNVDQLLSRTKEFDQKQVTVCGQLSFEFEDQNLYSSAEAAQSYDDDHCIAIAYRKKVEGDLTKLSGHRARLSGKYVAKFCPENTICQASCGKSGIRVDRAEPENP